MKIGILHHRVGKTDGVSLEIAKRQRLLEKMGHQVVLVSGPLQQGADYVIPDLQIPPSISLTPKVKIKRQLWQIQRQEKIELWFIHNILSLGRHPLAAKEVVEFLDRLRQPAVAVHHDFYWERKDLVSSAGRQLKQFWRKWQLPRRPYLQQVVINTLAANELWRRRRIHSLIFPDVFDFQMVVNPSFTPRSLRRRLGLDEAVVVLQTTRVVPRKGIELGLSFAAALQQRLGKRVAFLIGNYLDEAVPQSPGYYRKLIKYARVLGVEMLYLPRILGSDFSFWDNYRLADIISYPSLWEGYGNQFLEAVFFKKPILVFEYPVFKADIKPKGYEVISLGSRSRVSENGLREVSPRRIKHAVDIYLSWQRKGKLKRVGEKNLKIAQKHNSLTALRAHLEAVIRQADYLRRSFWLNSFPFSSERRPSRCLG